MSKVLVENSTLVNIAEAIRSQSENSFEMLPSEMPGHILNIDTEKVTIDDYKATEIMNLYSFQNQVVLEIDTLPTPTAPSGYRYQGKLYDGSKLYMKTTLTTVTDGSSSSSAGCTGTVLLIKPNGTQLSIDIPTYTIPSRSETGSSPDSYRYSCELYLSPDGDVYLRLQREFEDIYGSGSTDHETYYQSIYKLNISSSSLSWTNKVIEVSLGPDIYSASDYIIEDNYIYVAGRTINNTFTRYIYGYKYNDTSYEFQKISTNSIYQSTVSSNETVFIRKNTNTYIYFWGPSSSSSERIDDWISVTRNSDDTYTENKGIASFNGYHKDWKPFMLNGDVYIWTLGKNGYSGYEGFHIYKLNSDNSAWEVVYNIANVTSGDTEINTYLDNTLDTIFQGKSSDLTIRDDGTFDLIEFPPGSSLQHRLQVPTPTITIKNYETWYYNSYRYNSIGQKIFFFVVEIEDLDSCYKCVLEAIDGRPVLYSTFRESDVTG